MSSDPTQPVPEWGKPPQDPRRNQGSPEPQGFASQETQRLPAGQGYWQDDQSPGYQGGQGYRGGGGYRGSQGYQGSPAGHGYQAPPRARRRRGKWPLVTLIVIILVLVAGDRVANAIAEDQMASQMQSSLELSGKPHVSIQGFPFLTQLAARNFRTVDVNASNETAGPGGQLEISSLTATLHGMHIRSRNSATIDQFSASALISFTALGRAGGIPDGITLSADGPNRIKASIDLPIFSGSAVAQVTKAGPGKIHVQVVDAGGLPAELLGNLDFTISIPKLPAGVSIQSISVTQQGIRITAAGHDTTLSQ